MSEKPDTSQYKDSRNLKTRGGLHARYATKNWFSWAGEHMPLAPGSEVLDVGCGGGWFWKSVIAGVPAGIRLTLSDSSEGMVTEAVKLLSATGHFASVTGETADAARLPFRDHSFDTVIAMHMLYHVPKPEIAIAEFARVLRPGGLVAVTTNGLSNLAELFGLGAEVFGGAKADPAAALFNPETARDLLSKHFEAVTIDTFDDTYVIDDAEDVFQYLTSFPPGIDASASQRSQLRTLIDARLQEGGGVLKVKRESAVISGRLPA